MIGVKFVYQTAPPLTSTANISAPPNPPQVVTLINPQVVKVLGHIAAKEIPEHIAAKEIPGEVIVMSNIQKYQQVIVGDLRILSQTLGMVHLQNMVVLIL